MVISPFMGTFKERFLHCTQTCYCPPQVVVAISLGQLATLTALVILTDTQTIESVCGTFRPVLAAASPSPFMSLI